MPKVSHQVKARKGRSKWVRHRKGQTLDEYIAAQYRADPGLRRRVNAEVRKLLKEQDAARRKAQRARKRRAAQKARTR